MKRMTILAMTALLLAGAALAAPAKRGLTTVTQSDGTTLQVQALGDEFHHRLATADGLTIAQAGNGDYFYCTNAGISAVRAHDATVRSAAETAFLAAHHGEMTPASASNGSRRARQAAMRRAITQVPTLGSPRVPIILVEYQDKKMSHTLDDFEAHYKTGSKSVLQYFTDQSNGLYTPQYDLYGIYPLPENRVAYGRNRSGNDVGVAQMVNDAIDAAGDAIDWSRYDNDGDGEVDVCIVVYAGVGEAQAWQTVASSVWPCQWSLTEGKEWNDGSGPVTRNETLIDKFAVFNEIEGASDYGTTMDGIGTFCHEFSHCLGLPDFYCTTSSGYYGMGNWSLMDNGMYNGGSVSGDTPIGYSAYEKAYMNWIDLVTPVANMHYTLPVFNTGGRDTDVALKLTSPLNENEYFIVENRRQQGWDTYISDEGVMITHFTYVPDRWEANTVNDYALQLATIMAADNAMNLYTESRDLFGETNHEFTDESVPAAQLNMKANGSLARTTGGAGLLEQPLSEIYLNEDGTASLWYMKKAEAPLAGDVTGDGRVDVEDVNAVINVVLGIAASDELRAASDVTGDGRVDVEDVNAIINVILSIATS